MIGLRETTESPTTFLRSAAVKAEEDVPFHVELIKKFKNQRQTLVSLMHKFRDKHRSMQAKGHQSKKIKQTAKHVN